jgi:hypothetical protein
MKKYFILFFIIFFWGLKSYSQDFEVTSIDSTKNNYIIMVKNCETEYLILSPKTKKKKKFVSKNKRIKIGKKYSFLLVEVTFFAKSEPNLNNIIYVDKRIIWEKGDNFKIYFCENLKGLDFISSSNKE